MKNNTIIISHDIILNIQIKFNKNLNYEESIIKDSIACFDKSLEVEIIVLLIDTNPSDI